MMKKSLFAILLGAAFFIGTTACGGGETESQNATEEASTEVEATHDEHEGHDHATEEAATVAYACPMSCEGDKTYAEAGACPVCGMDLVEK